MRLYFSLMPKITAFEELHCNSLPFFVRSQFYSNIFYTPYIQLKAINQ